MLPARLVLEAQRAPQALRAPRDLRAPLGHKGLLVPPAQKGLPGHKACREMVVH